ncbi:hypothetical protein MPSEU_000164900 [Mayamaea pseudoterrestris]|nr:hypothetical protein MPSEU_000164900 [Mayamaea pseudoterrestris]
MPVKKESKIARGPASTKRAMTASAKRKKRRAKRKRSSAKTSTTAAPVTPPRKTIDQPTGDKVGYSPNSLAKCQSCLRKILQQEPRVGKQVYYAPRKAYYHQYYHQACFEREQVDQVNLSLQLTSGKSLTDELDEQRQMQAHERAILRRRCDLKQALKELRSLFARRLQRAHFLIFNDTVLHQLMLRMPRNKEELMSVNGFKEKRYLSFGEPVLQVIEQFRVKYEAGDASREDGKLLPRDRLGSVAVGRTRNDVIVVDDSEDDEDVVVGETLSCEEIVNRKFAHAAANNYLITVDH